MNNDFIQKKNINLIKQQKMNKIKLIKRNVVCSVTKSDNEKAVYFQKHRSHSLGFDWLIYIIRCLWKI